MDNIEDRFRSGFAALVGRPNVGKSTLLNALVGEKVAIVAPKAQTTRNRIPGILTTPTAQIVFLDTPGIHKPKHRLGQVMVKTAENCLGEVDLILFVVDGSVPVGRGDQYISELFPGIRTPVLLVMNKIDLCGPEDLETIANGYGKLHDFVATLPVSAVRGDNLPQLLDLIEARLPLGPKYYPEEMLTDQPEFFIVAELIREKVLHLTREEVPHAVAVEVQTMSRREDKDIVDIQATVFVERDSQKGIIIGHKGKMLKEIGQLARQDMEKLFGSQVFLELWVKVKRDWRDSPGALHGFGYPT